MNYRFLRSFCLLVIITCLLHSCKHKEKEGTKKPVAKVSAKPTSIPESKKTPGSPGSLEQKLGLTKKQIRDNKLYAFVEDWYGTPYKYGGCQKSGVDCSCFTNVLYETVYGKKIARSAADMFLSCEQVTLEEVKQGDLMFFKIGGNKISHVGVFLKGKLFVHSSTSLGVSINSVDEAYYKKYFFCAGKVKHS